jgi:hypothetical protein
LKSAPFRQHTEALVDENEQVALILVNVVASRARRGPALWRATPGFLTVSAVDGRSVQAAGSAAAIWQMLPGHDEAPVAVDALVARLAEDHGVAVELVERDTKRVLGALESIGCAVLDA